MPDDELAQTATAPANGQSAENADDKPAPLGKTLGRYRLERALGEGGMGVVHAAFDPDLERRVALKVLHEGRGGDDARQRLLREARAMARLTHANVVTVHEVGSAGGRDYVAMELVDGETLAEWLRAKPRKQDEILDAFRAAGRGLAAAHAAGLVHRDFKPHNVLRRRDGRICVTDFGLARGVEVIAAVSGTEVTMDGSTTPSSLSGLTRTGSVLGTPAYMAPEQWAGGTVGPAADQFAFCVALWEALTGERPFRGPTIEDLKREVVRGADLDSSKLPRKLRGALVRGLAADADKRWPNMDALLVAITRAERRPRLAMFAVAGAVVASAGIYVALGRGGGPVVAGCPAPARALASVWSPADASALSAAGRAELSDAFAADAKTWDAERTHACTLAPEQRGAALACLDGTLARFDAVHHAVEHVTGEVQADSVLVFLFDPHSCALGSPPRHAIAPTPDTIQALGFAIDSERTDTKATVDQVAAFAAKPGLDACSRGYALRTEMILSKDEPKQKVLGAEALNAADACGDDRLRGEVLVAIAPFEFETPTIGPKGRAAIEKAKIAIDRLGQADLAAKVELLRSRVAAQDKHWDEAFAAVDRAAEAFGKRGRLRAQLHAVLTADGLRFRRNAAGDLDAVRASLAKWRPIAVEHHYDAILEDMDSSDAYARLFLGDVAGAHPELVRLYKPEPHPDVKTQALTGEVVDAAGKPVAGAAVAAGQLVWLDSIGPVPFGSPEETQFRTTTTDGDGKFTIPDGAMGGAIVAQHGDGLAVVKLAPHVHLALAATRPISGKVKLGSVSRTKMFAMVMPTDHTPFGFLAPLDASGAFALPAVPTTQLYAGVSTWGTEFASDVQFSKVAAGRAPISGLELEARSTDRTLVVIVRSALAQPFDAAQVLVLPGKFDIKTVEDLEKIPDHSSIQSRFAKPIVGENIPKDAVGKTRSGDLIVDLANVGDGDVTACAIGLHGDLKDASFQRQMQAHRKELLLKCVVATRADRAVVVEAPPQKRFD